MNSRLDPCSADAFEVRYQEHPDPWNFATSPYERDRYGATLAALGRHRFDTAYEPGCSIGELTAQLATRCEWVLATDISPSAVARARARCAGLPNVAVRCAAVESGVPAPDVPARDIPVPDWDLIVFSELGYYFSAARLCALAGQLASRLRSDGEFLAVHWLGHSTDHVLHGTDVHRILRVTLPLTHVRAQAHEGFLIDVWVKP